MFIVLLKAYHNNLLKQILRHLWEDPNLSIKSKSLITYCLSKSTREAGDYVEMEGAEVFKALGFGRDAMRNSINECIKNGYAFKHHFRNDNGSLSECLIYISGQKEDVRSMKEIYKECALSDKKYSLNEI
jgi:hypothetical protein